jgi:hypothetical protein
MTWTQEKRARVRVLRSMEAAGTLSDNERDELQCLLAEMEADEAAYLAPATERLRSERLQIEAQNDALVVLADRRAALAERLERVLADARDEQDAIRKEVDRILQARQAPSTPVP